MTIIVNNNIINVNLDLSSSIIFVIVDSKWMCITYGVLLALI